MIGRGRVLPFCTSLVLALACSPPASAPSPPSSPRSSPEPTAQPDELADPTDARRAHHLLRRLTWGPRPGDLPRVSADLESSRARLLEPTPGTAVFRERLEIAGTPVELATRFPRVSQRARSMGADAQGDHRELGRRVQEAAIVRAIESDGALHEMLVDFYFNRLNVFIGKSTIVYFLQDYVQQVVERHLDGSFADMLLESARHPAMLLYLDNANSVAPRPGARGRRATRGLNENYARELLELHTLGVRSGYTQDDVRETARLLTGWNLSPATDGLGGIADRRFLFRQNQHDAGAKTILGQRYGAGEAEGRRLLRGLAADPRTRRRLAHDLALRFVSHAPTDSSVERIAVALGDEGDLRAAHAQVIALAERETEPMFKTPFDFVVSAARLVGGRVEEARPLRLALTRLRMVPYQQPLPTGYPHHSRAWRTSGAMLERMQIAWDLAHGLLGVQFDLQEAAPETRGAEGVLAWAESHVGALGESTRETLSGLHDNDDDTRRARLAALLASPEFNER